MMSALAKSAIPSRCQKRAPSPVQSRQAPLSLPSKGSIGRVRQSPPRSAGLAQRRHPLRFPNPCFPAPPKSDRCCYEPAKQVRTCVEIDGHLVLVRPKMVLERRKYAMPGSGSDRADVTKRKRRPRAELVDG